MSRTTPQGTQHTIARFRIPPEIISDVNTFDNQSVIDNLDKTLDVFEANGSGWKFDYEISFMISYAQYNPVGVVPTSPLQNLCWAGVFLTLRMSMIAIALPIQFWHQSTPWYIRKTQTIHQNINLTCTNLI